ncbi:NADH-cytochrome b5 reductase [Tieghemostelium lacteum]|uniref:NADH-cytochrome b5 reductase n=1 Tax=Tieghemostelium lacteum TaxID=361077 RepID=A0A151ZSC5_TIELA|nr:NADH-cytochrome b5 reductase [Tieghemostelium lacteum]|eukprot:KYQ96893.1 NADH-cytochrome b5 reductase [Tieghemostelium lacteum]
MTYSLNEYITIAMAILTTGAAAVGVLYLFTNTNSGNKKDNKNDKPKRIALNAEEYQKFQLKEKQIVNHNTRIFRFALPNPDDILGLPTGKHISIRANVNGQQIMRPYTPITSDKDLGYFDLLIKVYEKGAMTSHMDKLYIGEYLEFRGPKGKFEFSVNRYKSIGMIAGGTGITPMLQVIRAILENPEDHTEISLIFGNITEEDILLKADLDTLAASHNNFKVYYVLNTPPKGWTEGVGFISQEMISTRLPKPAETTQIVMCGPPMMNKAMLGHLETIGYSKESIFTF